MGFRFDAHLQVPDLLRLWRQALSCLAAVQVTASQSWQSPVPSFLSAISPPVRKARACLPESSSRVLVPSISRPLPAHPSSPSPSTWPPPFQVLLFPPLEMSHLTFHPAQIISYNEAVNRAGALPDPSFTRPCGSRPRRDASRTPPTLSCESFYDAVWLGRASTGIFPLHLHKRVR
jgi:hypothetical protein